jgi:hypothetical protein
MRSRRTAGVVWRLGGRTAPNAEPVDPAIRTTHSCHRIVECELLAARCKCVFDIMPCCCWRCRHRPASGIFPFRDRPARGYSCRCCEARPARREDAAPTRLPPRSRWRGTRATSRRDRARRSGRRINRRRSEAYSGNQKDGYEPGTQPTIGGTAESELSNNACECEGAAQTVAQSACQDR